MCCTIKDTATSLSLPRGMIISAYFFVGRQNSSKAGLTYLQSDNNIKLIFFHL